MKKLLPSISLLLLTACAAHTAGTTTYWIEPCTVMTGACQAGDPDLARWALAAWEEASSGRLHFVETKDRSNALFRVLWAGKNSGLYGETLSIMVHGRQGAELHILTPEPNREDPLLRDTVVYLTCLHEAGHGLGLKHTRAFADIMYNFQFGGDIDEYFGRYRRKLATRDDIQRNSGMSPADRTALLESVP